MFTIAALYQFAPVADVDDLRTRLLTVCRRHGVEGTLLIATEGINGTIAGPSHEAVAAVIDEIRSVDGFASLEPKWSESPERPFLRLKVKVKDEIVTLGAGPVDVSAHTATHVPAADWNALISRSDVVVIDTRNAYEVAIGSFTGAVDPQTESFTEFPDWMEGAESIGRDTPIAMFCTGGIRCEKATAYLAEQGFTNLFQLDGGILRYLEDVAPDQSMWEGECYVFDRRVSVGHGLIPGNLEVCPNCNQVVGDEARSSVGYVRGVTCPNCHDEITPDRLERFSERQKQIELAAERGSTHLGRSA